MKKYLIIVFLAVSSCTTQPAVTVIPSRVTQSQASFDGNEQDSGIKEFIPGKGFVISEAAAARYSALVIKYKAELTGLFKEGDKTFLNNEGMVLFLDLTDKEKNN